MKIVVTVHTYWPTRNGVQYVTQYLCEGLAAKGHNVTVITTVSDLRKVGRERHNNVNIIRAYLKTRYSVINYGVKEYRNIVLEEVKDADWLINCCVQSPANNVLLPMLKSITAKKMLYMHGMHDFKLQKNDSIDLKYKLWHTAMNLRWRLFYWWNKKNFCQYDALVDIHESSAGISYMRKLGAKAEAYVITNAVEDFDGILVSEDDYHTYPVLGETFFLNVSNFTSRKNQHMLVEAFHNMQEKHYSKLVLIGGKSDYCESVKKQIKEYNLEDQVLVYENQEREITRKFIKNCLCGVMSSRFEVYPIFLCEAISCGHPYISTDVGCVRDIPGGDIVKTTDDLSNAMQRMLEDESHRMVLAETGKIFANENLSQKSKIDQLEGILLSCGK